MQSNDEGRKPSFTRGTHQITETLADTDTDLAPSLQRVAMKLIPESDTGVALAAGAFTLLLFVLGIAIVSATSPTGVGRFELVGFGVGFGLFIGIYFLSMSADRLLKGDDKEQ